MQLKKYTLFTLLFLFIICTTNAQNKIKWMSVEEVELAMKTTPKKVYVDIFTDWCHWCKVMDKKTFTNKDVIAYMNENYYCIKLDAERKDEVTFNGKKYGLASNSRTNNLAVEWTRGQLSYPTSVFFDEGFQNPQPVPGFMEVPTMEMIAKYIAENLHKKVPFEQYKQTFKATWK